MTKERKSANPSFRSDREKTSSAVAATIAILLIMFLLLFFFFCLFTATCQQEPISPFTFFDCKHLVLPKRCQCYHSGHESQLRCLHIELDSLPKLPNNMRWNALDFSYNHITSIDNYVFADIYVEKINLKMNYIRRVEITAFDQIKNLKELYLDHNQLKQLHPQTFVSPGRSLEIFHLSHNPFQYLDIGEILLNLPLLKELHLVSTNLTDTSFYTLTKLAETTVDEQNHLVPKRGHHYLELLDLSYNNITTICSSVFDGLYNLIELRLMHNSIHLIDNNFLRSFLQIKTINFAHNSIEHVPKLSSGSLEILNFSSNHIHHLSDYFASHLSSIRLIDFDSNPDLNHTTARAFCFLNILSLERMTFRFDNLLSLNSFGELLCRLANQTEKRQQIDINHNVNLKCHCSLIQFQTYLDDYQDLTCTQQGQDRYYISKLTNWFSNCSFDFCLKRPRQLQADFCNWAEAERYVNEGTCETKLRVFEHRKRNKEKLSTSTITTVTTTPITAMTLSQSVENFTDIVNVTSFDNATIMQSEKQLQSSSIRTLSNAFFLFVSIALGSIPFA